MVFNDSVTNHPKLSNLKQQLFTPNSAAWAVLGRNGLSLLHRVSTGWTIHDNLRICLACQLVLTRCHPLSKWPFHVASVGFLPSRWPQSAQTFHTVASFPQTQEEKFPDLLSIWAHTSQNVISTTFYQSKQSQGQPSSRGGHSTRHEYQEARLAGATGKRDCDKQLVQKFWCGNQ